MSHADIDGSAAGWFAGPRRMRIALLTTDNREHFREYEKTVPYFGTAPQALLEGLAECPEAEVHVVSCTKQPMTAPVRLAENIWFHSLVVPPWGWLRGGFAGCVWAVRRKLRDLRPDLAHGQGTERDCALSAVCSGFKNLVTIHGNMADMARVLRARIGSYYWLVARLEDYTLKRTAGVVCNSRFTERMVRDRAPRTWRIPNPVSTEFFAPARPRPALARPVLLNVGGIAPNKQQLELLEAAGRWRHRGLNFELRFIGRAEPGNPYATRFLEAARAPAARGWAFYEGPVSPRELVERFDAASALVHVSLAESFGLVAAEALARDLKYFGSAAGGLADVLEDAPGAVVTGPGNWDRLGEELGAWIAQGTPRVEGAAALMQERYHPRQIAQRHLEVYRELLSTRS